MTERPRELFTIGHSTHPIGDFIGLLAAHRVKTLVDVRAFPPSRYNPQFNQDALASALRQAGIDYLHMVSLGGFRKQDDDTAGSQFSAYIHYTKTVEFKTAIQSLSEICLTERTVVMCAEALWHDCHRQFIAEAMQSDGFEIVHIMDDARTQELARAPRLPGF